MEKGAGCVGGRWLKAHSATGGEKKNLNHLISSSHLLPPPSYWTVLNPIGRWLTCAWGVGYGPKLRTSGIPNFMRFLLHLGAMQPMVTFPGNLSKIPCKDFMAVSILLLASLLFLTQQQVTCASCFFPSLIGARRLRFTELLIRQRISKQI